jgi:hypothetical protein
MGVRTIGTLSTLTTPQPSELPPGNSMTKLGGLDPLTCDFPAFVLAQPSTEPARAHLAPVSSHREKGFAEVRLRISNHALLARDFSDLPRRDAPVANYY